MSVGIFAKKVGMTQIFDDTGNLLPVTILKMDSCKITQIKTKDTDGYNAVQVGYNPQAQKKLNKATLGHLQKSSTEGFKSFGEFHVEKPENYKLGESVQLDTFTKGQKVRLTGKSIGKGFTGNQKRHNFSRGPMTHGSKNHRLPGSIGAGSTPGRVYPGKKMAGHLGNSKVTLKNTEILYVNSTESILVVKGSVPGKKNSVVKIQPQKGI
jgi:large subunit ribosomal protein L3